MRRHVEGTDAKLLIDAFIPGHEPFSMQIAIKNLVGNTRPPQREPEAFRRAIVRAMCSEFGRSVR